MSSTPTAFHLLAKPTGAVCNLDCAYCFFLSKEMLYPGSSFRMADDLLETYIRQLIEAHARVPEVMIAWQGGEPTLMGLDFFRRSVELADALPAAGPARREHDPDERHAARRRVGRVLRRATTSWSDSRSTGRARFTTPTGSTRAASARSTRSCAGSTTCARCGRVERPDDDPRRQRRPRTRGLPVPPRRVRCAVHPVHPDPRAASRRPPRTGRCRGRRGATVPSTSRREAA